MKFLLALSLLSSVLAQDTYHCPDGWVLEEDRSGCRCFWFEGTERVSRDNADLLCQSHDAWVAELDHPGINYWLKSQLLKELPVANEDAVGIGYCKKYSRVSRDDRVTVFKTYPSSWWYEGAVSRTGSTRGATSGPLAS